MPTIVLVDDDDLILELLLTTLEEAGYRVISVSNEVQGRQALLHHQPALLISDLRLGNSWDGVALICLARSQRLRLPTLAMSGHGEEALRMAAMAGASVTLHKPLRLPEFIRVVAGLLAADAPQ
jgi:DNA-binding response OmpR family regulator